MSSKGKKWLIAILVVLVALPFAAFFTVTQLILKPTQIQQDQAEQLAKEVTLLRGKYGQIRELELARTLIEEQLSRRSTALDVLDVVALHIPNEVTLDSVTFSESRGSGGNNITLRGKVEQDDRNKLQKYSDRLRMVKVLDEKTDDRKDLFSQVQPPNMDARAGGYLSWYIICWIRQEETTSVKNGASSGQRSTPATYRREKALVMLINSKKRKSLKESLTRFEQEKANLGSEGQLDQRLATLKSELNSLLGSGITLVPSQDHALKLMRMLDSKGRRSGLNIIRSRGRQGSTRSDKEFEELKRTISFQSDMFKLVDFLKNMSEEPSMIRVSDMKVFPTADRKQLRVDLTFVTSYPKPKPQSKSKKSKKK